MPDQRYGSIYVRVKYQWWYTMFFPLLKWLVKRGWLDSEWIAKAGVSIVTDPPVEDGGDDGQTPPL